MSDNQSSTSWIIRFAIATVIAVIFLDVVVSALLKSVKSEHAAADRNVALNRLRLIGMGFSSYQSKNGHFPPSASYSSSGRPLLSWRVTLLPFIEEQALYDQFHLNEAWDSPHNATLIGKMPSIYESGGLGLTEKGKTCFMAPIGKKAAFFGHDGRSSHDFAGCWGRTIFLVEAAPTSAVVWTKPDDLLYDEKDPLAGLVGARDGGFVALYPDNSVRQIPPDTPTDVVSALFTIDGSKRIPPNLGN
jgi:Protein of unknown function (DUF1559)